MRILCTHGYFRFEEDRTGEISDFVTLYGLEIERNGDHFTFGGLVGAPTHSLPGGTFLGCPTLFAFEGAPWEVMKANRLVYDFTKGFVVPIDSVLYPVTLQAAGNFYLAGGMIIPGSVMEDGTRVRDYAASFEKPRFKYSEVSS